MGFMYETCFREGDGLSEMFPSLPVCDRPGLPFLRREDSPCGKDDMDLREADDGGRDFSEDAGDAGMGGKWDPPMRLWW